MKSPIPVISLLIFLVSTSSLQAAEFAYSYSAGIMDSKSAGKGTSVMGGYGGFGLTGSIEYKAYETKKLLAGYVGIRAPLIAEIGLTSKGLSLRGGVAIPVIQNMDFFDSSSLFFVLSYEKFLNDDDFSGAQASIQLMIFD